MAKLKPFTQDEIYRQTRNFSTIKKGKTYYRENRVNNVRFNYVNDNRIKILSEVHGSYHDYNVEINVLNNGVILNSKCECLAYTKYSGACKHIIATLLESKEILGKTNWKIDESTKKDNKEKKALNYLFNQLIIPNGEVNKQIVNILPILELDKDIFSNEISLRLELKIGFKQLYIVKNLKQFIDNYENNREIYFGKKFEYNKNTCILKDEDKQLLKLIEELSDLENLLKSAENYSHYYKSEYLFKDRKVILAGNYIDRFFEIYGEHKFEYRDFNNTFSNYYIEKGNNKLFQIDLINENEKIVAKMKNADEVYIIGKKQICKDDKIYYFDEDKVDKIKKITKGFSISEGKITIDNNMGELIISKLINEISNIGTLVYDDKLDDLFEKEELITEVYLDKIDGYIKIKVKFIYGEIIINGISTKRDNDKKIIFNRDYETEEKLIRIITDSGFKVHENGVILNEDNEVEFITEYLPKINEMASVFCTKSFENINVKTISNFSIHVGFKEDSSMLDIDFNIDGINQDEIAQVLRTVREKKKYHRLKNGTYLRLVDRDLISATELIDILGLKDKDLENGTVFVPKYRGLYLDEHLKLINSSKISRDKKYRNMVQNIKMPQEQDYEIPKELNCDLRNYQVNGFKWLKTLQHYGLGGILADDMGLGKTVQTLSFILSEYNKVKKTSLIVVPTSLIYNWIDEAEKFTPSMKVLAISGTKKERKKLLDNIDEYQIIVTSYSLIRNDIELYEKHGFAYCFLDEAQKIKNHNSLSAKSVKKINASARFVLTGTPIENALTELWSIFDFVMPGYLYNHNRFVNKYEKPIMKDNDKRALELLSNQIKPFVLRRMKRDVLSELPPKIESRVIAELNKEQKKIYLGYLEKAKQEMEDEIDNSGFNRSKIKILSLLTRLRQISCHPGVFIDDYKGGSGKLDLLLELINESVSSGHRILIFSQFTSMLKIIREELDNEKIDMVYLDGATKIDERRRLVNDFNKGEGDIFLISLKAGGTGLNLTGADMVIHFDPWWNPAVEDQATDRAYRIGQDKSVQVIKLISKGTIEEKIYSLQQKKKDMINNVITSADDIITKMTEKEIKELFEY